MKIKCDQSFPTEVGYYIFMGALSNHVEMVKVIEYTHDFNGIPYRDWERYLGVPSYRGRNVERLQGSWSQKLEFEKVNYECGAH